MSKTKNTRLKTIRIDDLNTFEPKGNNQFKAFKSYDQDRNLVLSGVAGTGKTFTALYLGLEEVLDPSIPYTSITIVRSVVPTRNLGFLPGDEKEKVETYEAPYKSICRELFSYKDAYEALKQQNDVIFLPTSFIRGITISDSIIIVDEMQNLTFHELDSIITRVGDNCKIIFCGDYTQSDLTRSDEKQGLKDFMKILHEMDEFDIIEFGVDDIVRSGFLKSYITTKYRLNL